MKSYPFLIGEDASGRRLVPTGEGERAVGELKEVDEWERYEERVNYSFECEPESTPKGSPLPARITFILRGKTLEVFTINFELRQSEEKGVDRDNIEEVKRQIRSHFQTEGV